MPALARFDPPAFMDDLDQIPHGREQWDAFLDICFRFTLAREEQAYSNGGVQNAKIQYFNPKAFDPPTPVIEQPILWNAFPKTMLLYFGRDRALAEADELIPYAPANTFPYFPGRPYPRVFDPANPASRSLVTGATEWTRQTDEYCEWQVERDRMSRKITRVTLTSEPPEYWQALFGAKVDLGPGFSHTFHGEPKVAAALYAKLLGVDRIDPDDLRAKKSYDGIRKGDYNPYNLWNTTQGIAHLCCPPNAISAEVILGGDATVLYRRPDGEPVTNPDELICRAQYGGMNRNSDPTIGSTVNALARAGAMISLANPVGLYMDNIDLAGWEMPGGIAATDCVTLVRGRPGQIERLVVEAPPESGACIGDLTIGGEPLRYGGQIAECITVKLTGAAWGLGTVTNPPINGSLSPFMRRTRPSSLYAFEAGSQLPDLEPAFSPVGPAAAGAPSPGPETARRTRGAHS